MFEEIWSTDSSPNSMQFYTIKSEKLLPYDKVDFVMDDYANLVGIEVNGESRPLHWFHRFTYPEVKPESYFYGVSDLTKIHREWYTKDVLKKYRNIGLENFAFPIVLVTFDQYKYRRGSQEWDKLWELVNGIKNDARLMVPGSRNISEMAGILPDVDIKFLEPSFGGSGFNAFETAIESENKAIARNLGMPDNLGYSDVGSGSYAKSQTEYDLYWRNVVDIAEAVQDSVQEVVDRLLRYNYPTERARFVFDLSRDKGITSEKVAILQGMIAAGVKPTKEYVAGFLDLGESDFDLDLDTVIVSPTGESFGTQRAQRTRREHGEQVEGEKPVSGSEEFSKKDSKKKDKKAKKKIKAFKYQMSPDADLKEGSEHHPFCEAHDDEIIAADDPRLKFITPPNHYNCKSKLIPVMVYEKDLTWGEGTYSDVEKYPMTGFGRAGAIKAEAQIQLNLQANLLKKAKVSGIKVKIVDREKQIYRFGVKSPKDMDNDLKIKGSVKVRFGKLPNWNNAKKVPFWKRENNIVTLNEMLLNATFVYVGGWDKKYPKYKVDIEDIFLHELSEIYYKTSGTGGTDKGRKYNNYWRKRKKQHIIKRQGGSLSFNKIGRIGTYYLDFTKKEADEKFLPYYVVLEVYNNKNEIVIKAILKK